MNHRVPVLFLALCAASPLVAGTVQDFDAAGDGYTLGQYGSAPAATVSAGGPSGNFLRLVSGAATNALNTIGFDRTDKGAYCTLEVDFDFRIVPGSGSADGIGLALLNTGYYGDTGAVSTAEEPNLAKSLGVGFDVYQNGADLNANHVSIHFDGTLATQIDATPVVDLDGTAGQFIHARVVVNAGRAAGDVTVELTPPGGSPTRMIDALAVPGLTLYEARPLFGARTGGQTADHDLDNVQVSYTACPTVVGQWGAPIATPVIPIHADLLPSGEVLFWDRDDTDDGPGTPHLFDPAAETTRPAPDPGYDLFCSGHSFLPDGTLFVSGGHDEFDGWGLPYGTLYDTPQEQWTTAPQQMNAGRWYPTNTTLPNGDQLVVSGTSEPGLVNDLPQVYEVATGNWRDLTSAVRNVPLYSFFHLAPNGMAFNSGPETTTRYLDTSGTGAWINVAATGSVFRDYGSSALYEFGKVLLTGGGNPPTRTSQVIDLLAGTPAWRSVESMDFVRRQLNLTIMADGALLVSGGTGSAGFNVVDDAVFAAESWDPVSETWTTMAAAAIPRIYHSFALLLPDARVLTGGGGHPPGAGPPGDLDHYDVEAYSPPYLFQGPRPSITSAPAAFGYGDTFFVETPTPDEISAVHLIRNAAVTHSFNQNQWIARLPFSTTPQGLVVTAPTNAIAAQPGPYMLFILNDAGVPSVAPIVQLLPDAGRVPGASLRLDKSSAGDVVLAWGPSCSSADFDYAIYEGPIGNWGAHLPRTCSTGGATSATITPAGVGSYYLVVPRNSASEGSHGVDGDGAERVPPTGTCFPQSLGACP